MSHRDFEKSPTWSEYSLPCLSSDDTPYFADSIDIWGMSADGDLCSLEDNIELPSDSEAFDTGTHDVLILSPPLAQPSILVDPATSQESSLAIREFPLLATSDPESFRRESELIERPIVEPRQLSADCAGEGPHASADGDFMFPDPTTICPWCDSLLPDPMSAHLQAMIEAVRKKSRKSPRPGNLLGLYVEFEVFSHVCARHEAEKTDPVLAAAQGWPLEVNWALFIRRVIGLRPQFQRIIDDVDEEWQPRHTIAAIPKRVKLSVVEDLQALMKRPRKESWVWKSFINDVISKGPLYAAGIDGQWGNFERKLPGYYGEIGTYILSKVLWTLFPDDVFPENSTYPLSVYQFRETVLLPEAAIMLIMSDQHIDHSQAVKVMLDSSRFGMAWFSYNDDDFPDQLLLEAFPPNGGPVVKQELNDDEDNQLSVEAFPLNEAPVVKQELTEGQCMLSQDADSKQTKEMKGLSLPDNKQRMGDVVASGYPANPGSSPQPQPGPSTFSSENVRSRLRRRRIPRSSIPEILSKGLDEGESVSEDIPIPKKARRV